MRLKINPANFRFVQAALGIEALLELFIPSEYANGCTHPLERKVSLNSFEFLG